MTFTTLTFLLFLALVFSSYWLTRSRVVQNFQLVLASYAFYSWWDWRFCGLMLISSLTDYLVGLGLRRAQRPMVRYLLLACSLVVNLGLLAFFKYFKFFVHSFSEAMHSIGWEVSPWTLKVVLPVGISFYTFQTLSYTIDVYRRKFEPTRNALDFFAFVCFFPQLMAGPIERARSLMPQFLRPRWFDPEDARDGLRRILWGFFKKMVLADNLALIVDAAYARDVLGGTGAATGPQLIFATVCFAFQIYCDFSAYSDIAIGTARLFGIRLMRNFAYPYFAQDVSEFWRRWHISLSTWFRDYVYIPLGGNRTGRLRWASSVLITFVVSGFWHGASWKFVIWGGLHGLAFLPVALWGGRSRHGPADTPGGESLLPSRVALLRMVVTFAFVCVAWVFFRARTLGDAMTILRKIITELTSFDAIGEVLHRMIDSDQHQALMIHLVAFVVVEWVQRRRDHALDLPGWPRWCRWLIYTALIWDVLYFGTRIQGAFLYFQF